jgi:hypothetical protein
VFHLFFSNGIPFQNQGKIYAIFHSVIAKSLSGYIGENYMKPQLQRYGHHRGHTTNHKVDPIATVIHKHHRRHLQFRQATLS